MRKLSAADPSVELGDLVAVVYRKGQDKVLTDYEHEFEHPRPRLAYNERGLVIAGGGYRVEERGTVDQRSARQSACPASTKWETLASCRGRHESVR